MVYVVLFKGRGFMSRLIEWQTRGEYSHAALLVGETLYESWQSAGVRKKEGWGYDPSDKTVSLFQFGHSYEDESRVTQFLEKQIGKKYDWLAIVRFLTRTHILPDDKKRWFCSELVFTALASAEIDLFKRTKGWEVSPDMIKRSGLLAKI